MGGKACTSRAAPGPLWRALRWRRSTKGLHFTDLTVDEMAEVLNKAKQDADDFEQNKKSAQDI